MEGREPSERNPGSLGWVGPSQWSPGGYRRAHLECRSQGMGAWHPRYQGWAGHPPSADPWAGPSDTHPALLSALTLPTLAASPLGCSHPTAPHTPCLGTRKALKQRALARATGSGPGRVLPGPQARLPQPRSALHGEERTAEQDPVLRPHDPARPASRLPPSAARLAVSVGPSVRGLTGSLLARPSPGPRPVGSTLHTL